MLSVTNGTLEVEEMYAGVTGNIGKSVTIQGTQAEVNAELASLEYTYSGATKGADTLTIDTRDNGNFGGLHLTDTDTVAISVVGEIKPSGAPVQLRS